MSIQRILALTDLSANSASGLALAEGLAKRLHARVVVGYAHTRSDILRDFGRSEKDVANLADWVRRDDEERLHALAGEHVEKLRIDGFETVQAHNAREGVAQLIERARPDLVCMATRGRSGVQHLLLGSVAEHTLRTAGVPVIVTKGATLPDATEPLRVLVSLDLIDEPDVLARRVADLLGPGDQLALAHVVESSFYSSAPYGSEFSLPQPDVPALVAAAGGRLRGIEFGKGAPAVTVHVATGRPGQGILGLEDELEPHIVVARTHGRRGFDRMMLGSVSEFLARKCRAAVLVYPKLS